MNKNLGGGGNEEIPVLEGNASLAGYDMIELMWTKNGKPRNGSVGKIHCFEIPVLRGRRKGNLGDDNVDSKMVSGTVKFYPDDAGYNWAYVVDSPNNRKKLANSFKTGWYKIMNIRTRDEIKKLAEEMGLSTSKLDKPKVNIKKTVREIKADENTRKVEKELDESKQRMADLEKLIIEMQETGEAKLSAPLAGVKVKIPVVTEGKTLDEMNRIELTKYMSDNSLDITVPVGMTNRSLVILIKEKMETPKED